MPVLQHLRKLSEDAFDHDFGVDLLAQNAFESALDGHCRVRTAAAGAAQLELDGLPFDSDDLQISAVRLQVDAELFQPVGDSLGQIFHISDLLIRWSLLPPALRPDGIPKFIVETLSPSTAFRDRTKKKEIYESCGVEEYWIVSSLEKAVEIYYLGENGSYSLKDVFVLDDDISSPSYNGKLEISLKAFPHVHLRLEEIFENL